MSKYPSQMQDKFNLRFPDGMREVIAERAKRNGRSMNSEIIQILEDAIVSDSEKTHEREVGSLRSEISYLNTDILFSDRASQPIDEKLKKLDEITKRLESLLKSSST